MLVFIDTLDEFLAATLENHMLDNYKMGRVFWWCFQMNRLDLLFGRVFHSVVIGGSGDIFVRALELFCQDGGGPGRIRIPTRVLDYVVKYFQDLDDTDTWNRLEDLVLRFEFEGPVDTLIHILEEQGLWRGLVWVFETLQEWVEVLVVLLPRLDGDESCARTLVEYLTWVLDGKLYPFGDDIPASQIQTLRAEIWIFLLEKKHVSWPKGASRLVKVGSVEPYPYLSHLIQNSMSRFVDLLDATFRSDWMNQGLQIYGSTPLQSQFPRMDPKNPYKLHFLRMDSGTEINRQFILETCLEVLTNETNEHDRVLFYCFLVKACAKYPAYIHFDDIFLRQVLMQIIKVPELDSDSDDELSPIRGPTHLFTKNRQSAIISLLAIYDPIYTAADQLKFPALFARAGFWTVLESWYTHQKQYTELVEVFFQNPELDSAVFEKLMDVIRCLASPPGSPLADQKTTAIPKSTLESPSSPSSPLSTEGSEGEACKAIIFQNIPILIHLHPAKTAFLVESLFPAHHDSILDSLEAGQLLNTKTSTASSDRRWDLYWYLKALLEIWGVQSTKPKLNAKPKIMIIKVQERYIHIMCQIYHQGVLPYLETMFDSNSGILVSFEKILAWSLENRVLDASVWIMEKLGNPMGGVKVLVDEVRNLIREVTAIDSAFSLKTTATTTITTPESFDDVQRRLRDLGHLVHDIVALNQRSKRNLSNGDVKKAWGMILDALLEPLKVLDNRLLLEPSSQGLHGALNVFLKTQSQQVMMHMVGIVPPSQILNRIFQERSKAGLG